MPPACSIGGDNSRDIFLMRAYMLDALKIRGLAGPPKQTPAQYGLVRMDEQPKTNINRTLPLGSAPVGMIWDGSPSVEDFLMAKHRALTVPAQQEALRRGCVGAGVQTGHPCTSMPSNDVEDRLTVNWTEWRKGYSYSVEAPQPGMPGGLSRSSDMEGWPPKELLDQSGSNDFSAYKEIQELQAACGLLSPKLASSPFAKHTQRPFVENASCRSRLSDYGFSSESEDEQGWDGCYGNDMDTPLKDQAPPEGFGFWAEVGAIGNSQSLEMSHEVSCDTHCKMLQGATPEKHTPGAPQVVWEVNVWNSPSDGTRPNSASIEEPSCQQAAPEAEERPSAVRQAVLLPWDMM